MHTHAQCASHTHSHTHSHTAIQTQVFQTNDDEGLFEMPFIWGSNCKFNVGAFIRVGPVRLYIPVEVSNIHVKAEVCADRD
jgi:hypothetical protein